MRTPRGRRLAPALALLCSLARPDLVGACPDAEATAPPAPGRTLATVLQEISDAGLTGALRFDDGDVIKVIYVSAGHLAFASSSLPADRLGPVLVRSGRLTQAQLDAATARAAGGAGLGKALVELGSLTPRDLLEGCKLQVVEIVRSLRDRPVPDRAAWTPVPAKVAEVDLGIPLAPVIAQLRR